MNLSDPPRPPAAAVRTVAASAVRAGQALPVQDCVAEEVPVALEYNGIAHAVMMATPADLEDFGCGFSVTEGIVDNRHQILDCACTPSAAGYTLQLTIAAGCFARLKDKRRSLTGRTGCGLCGTESLAQAVRLPPPLQTTQGFASSAVTQALADLRARQPLLGATGATHAAAWCDAQGQIVLLREDVGRHNALDKLIGALLRADHAAGVGFIVITSRASYEMVQKTAVAGVGLLVAVSGVTGLAIDVAQGCGLTLVGFARGADATVYSHPQRFNLKEA